MTEKNKNSAEVGWNPDADVTEKVTEFYGLVNIKKLISNVF